MVRSDALEHGLDSENSRNVWLWCRIALVVSAANGGVISTLREGCHFYLAPTAQPPRSGAETQHTTLRLARSFSFVDLPERHRLGAVLPPGP